MSTTTMKAVVLDGPGPAGALQIRKIPVPTARAGWALIAVKAFGLNRSELHARLGLAEGMAWPRVLGAEAVGVIETCPGVSLPLVNRSPRWRAGWAGTSTAAMPSTHACR
jgi:NADPH:quinone reductase